MCPRSCGDFRPSRSRGHVTQQCSLPCDILGAEKEKECKTGPGDPLRIPHDLLPTNETSLPSVGFISNVVIHDSIKVLSQGWGQSF